MTNEIKRKKAISIKSVVVIIYSILVIIAFTVIIYALFNTSMYAARKEADVACSNLNNDILNIIQSSIDTTNHINKVYGDMISSRIISINDKLSRDALLINFLKNHSDYISAFAYIDAKNNLYAALYQNNMDIQVISENEMVISQKTEFFNWLILARATNKAMILPVSASYWSPAPTIKSFYPISDSNGLFVGILYIEIDLMSVYEKISSSVVSNTDVIYIIDKDTDKVIFSVNSGLPLSDASIKEYKINKQYLTYITTSENAFSSGGLIRGNYYTFKEYSHDMINWVIATSVPHRFYLDSFRENMSILMLFTVLSFTISLVLYHLLSDKLIKPLGNLVDYASDISNGNLDVRVPVFQDNEIGKLSYAFNQMTKRLKNLVSNLEKTVDERTDKLTFANEQLKESKEQLQIILNSTAEAIYGVDLDGICTFCNISCLKILGYESEDKLLGKRMHDLLFDTSKNPHSSCRIVEYIKKGHILHEDNGEFLKADGSSIYVEFHSYPQYKNNKVIGAVVTFLDISQKKSNIEQIRYLSYHDVLTGLPNRRKFEVITEQIDISNNIPYSVIYADINNLKMTNDIFGHDTGDNLIVKAAQIIKNNVNEDAFIARIGGDEFIILLSKTDYNQALSILNNIKEEIHNTKIAAIMCSISIGAETITDDKTTIEQAISNAENKMYREKVMNRKSNNTNLLKDLINTLHERSPREITHSENVSALSEKIAIAMKLSEPMVKRIKLAGYMHDIGKIVLNEAILKKDYYSDEEREQFHLHPVHGYRILNLFDDTLDIAEGVYCHHEKWDGTGYPKGLKETEIPLIARIIAVAEAYDALVNRKNDFDLSKEEALKEIKDASGISLDPYIADLFVDIM
ncbi:MAG TPA: diguanylate cyclase [Clostridia bacterium]|nr:diguanylate cyclase [Clostridia bacterium]